MNMSTRIVYSAVVAAACAAIALAFLPDILHGDSAGRPAPQHKFVVHEWGTFTSFAGDNGVNLEFRPLSTSDLPPFVKRPDTGLWGVNRLFLKDQFVARQRMETPVTYFYTDVPRLVNVRVDFPQGMLTEWYPAVKRYASGQPSEGGTMGRAFLDWGTVRLTPAEQFADVRVRGPNGKAEPASLPAVAKDDHYGRARETDSAIVETVDEGHGSHFEKFLFYRGLGNSALPIKLIASGNDRFEIVNSGDDPSGALLLVRIEGGRSRFARLKPVGPRSTTELNLPRAESTVDQLADAMVHELTEAGLYEKEALAMVNTWRTSWFGESGTRLLYLLPGTLVDQLLPLTLDPAPDERVRVLVGRLETLTPEDCQRLARALAGDGAGAKPTDHAIKAELASLGRFAEPAIRFVIDQSSDPSARSRLKAILDEIRSGK